MKYDELVERAQAAREMAVAPYSRFRVGAALLTADGLIYTGCNVENSSYGLTMCAERVALFKAVSEGERAFRALAIATDDPGFTSPCGACRQVIMDLAGDIDFIMVGGDGSRKIVRMSKLLPLAFGGENLLRTAQRLKRKK